MYGLNREQNLLLDAALCATTDLEDACAIRGIDRAAWLAAQIAEEDAILEANAYLWEGIENEEDYEDYYPLEDKADDLKRVLMKHIDSKAKR